MVQKDSENSPTRPSDGARTASIARDVNTAELQSNEDRRHTTVANTPPSSSMLRRKQLFHPGKQERTPRTPSKPARGKENSLSVAISASSQQPHHACRVQILTFRSIQKHRRRLLCHPSTNGANPTGQARYRTLRRHPQYKPLSIKMHSPQCPPASQLPDPRSSLRFAPSQL